jgi:hypothetical protein
MPLKKLQQIKTTAVGSRVFTLEDLIGEMNDRGLNIQKVTHLPDSQFG